MIMEDQQCLENYVEFIVQNLSRTGYKFCWGEIGVMIVKEGQLYVLTDINLHLNEMFNILPMLNENRTIKQDMLIKKLFRRYHPNYK